MNDKKTCNTSIRCSVDTRQPKFFKQKKSPPPEE